MMLAFLSVTHGMIAAAGIAFIFKTAEPFVLLMGILGSQLPDIDTTSSYIGRIGWPFACWIEERFPHRSITHSLLATGIITAVVLPIGYSIGYVKVALALPLGHLLSSFSDTFTKQGVQWLWPLPTWVVSVRNPQRRITTGSPVEYFVLAVATVALLLGIWVADGGGVTQIISQELGLKEGWFTVYNQNAATHEVFAQVQGVKASDRQKVDENYRILGVEGSDFIITDSHSVYKTYEQIIPTHLKVNIGQNATTTLQTLTFDDEEIFSRLQQLANDYPHSEIWLSGSLTVDLPEEIHLFFTVDQFPTLKLSGSNLTLTYHPLYRALVDLQDQYVTGILTAKIITLEEAEDR